MNWLRMWTGGTELIDESKVEVDIGLEEASYIEKHMPIGTEFDYLGVRMRVTCIRRVGGYVMMVADYVTNVVGSDGRMYTNVIREHMFSYGVVKGIVEDLGRRNQ